MIGKKIRIERIINRKTGRCVIVPMDHGVSIGPVEGIIKMAETIDEAASGGANAVIMHKGMVGSGHRGYGRDIGLNNSSYLPAPPWDQTRTIRCW